MEMLSVHATAYCDPSGYQLSTLPRPTVSGATDVVIKVHAASINPIDVKKASGILRMAVKDEFPYKIGYDCAGVVVEVGTDVTGLKIGDEVYARLPEASRGTWSEYAKSTEHYVALKPKSISFSDAASIPLAAMTALQAFRKYNGSLAGKTVFVPAGLSGTGAYACQLAKRVFNAGKVITTVSTRKVPMVPELLGEGVVDQIIDYTKQDPRKAISPKSVDFLFDTTGQAMQSLSLMVPSTSTIISIATQPSPAQLQDADVMRRPDHPTLPLVARTFLGVMDSFCKLRARRWQVTYEFMFLDANAKDLDTLRGYIDQGKLVPVVGSTADFNDIEKVREAADLVYKGKGGLGKAVIVMSQS